MPAKRTLEERFWPKVAKAHADECWLWTAAAVTIPGGGGPYGVIFSGEKNANGNKRHLRAHRVAYELTVGPIPVGLEIDHLCRNTLCVNPAHLEPVSPEENSRRTRVTHCKRGHPFNGGNLGLYSGRRQCKACNAERARGYRALRRRGDTQC